MIGITIFLFTNQDFIDKWKAYFTGNEKLALLGS